MYENKAYHLIRAIPQINLLGLYNQTVFKFLEYFTNIYFLQVYI
uniref:Uncharacterized protein n=1 Tax=Arundo donax TaxID=35708 RepID=A0A0A9BMR6_ARUDO